MVINSRSIIFAACSWFHGCFWAMLHFSKAVFFIFLSLIFALFCTLDSIDSGFYRCYLFLLVFFSTSNYYFKILLCGILCFGMVCQNEYLSSFSAFQRES